MSFLCFGEYYQLFHSFLQTSKYYQPSTGSFKYPFNSNPALMWLPGNELFRLEVTSWSRDVHGLFDYKAPQEQYRTSTHQISNRCRIYRNSIHNQHFFDIGNRVLPKYYDFVCEPQKSQDYNDQRFSLKWTPPKRQNVQNQLFKVARQPYLALKDYITRDPQRSQEFQGYPLEVGNVLRLGLIQFTVKKMVNQSTLRPYSSLEHLIQKFQSDREFKREVKNNNEEGYGYGQKEQQEDNSQTRARKRTIKKHKIKSKKISNKNKQKRQNECISEQQSSQIIEEQHSNPQQLTGKRLLAPNENNQQNSELGKQECKFCLTQQQNSVQDPLISPCECKGSVRRVHLSCFMHWVNSKLSFGDRNQVKTYTLQKNRCQVCKKTYPESIRCGSKSIDLIKIQKPEGPFMLLKSVREREKDKLYESQISYIVIPGEQGKPITIGRIDGNEVKVNDISISRRHCEIFYKNGRFFAKDLGSKFGTLLKFEKTHHFDFHPAHMQIGRITYKFSPLSEPPFEKDFEDCR